MFRTLKLFWLKNNKTRNYLLYAIGEIIVVVIGILIALYLDSWYEKRKEVKVVEDIFKQIDNDLQGNLIASSVTIEDYFYRDSIYQLLANNKVSKIEFKNNEEFNKLGFDATVFNNNNKGSNDLKNVVKDIPEHYENSYRALEASNLYFQVFESEIKELQLLIDDMNTTLAETKPWYSKINDSVAINRKLDYMHSDPFYKNYLYRYNNSVTSIINYLSNYHAINALNLVEIYGSTHNEITKKIIDSLWSSTNFKPFINKFCDTVMKKKEHIYNEDITMAFPFFNLSKDSITISLFNIDKPNKTIENRTVRPSEGTPINVDYGVTNVKLIKNKTCVASYVIDQMGYVVYED